MAEEEKTVFKPVDVQFDAEGNPTVKEVEVETPAEEEQEEQEDNTEGTDDNTESADDNVEDVDSSEDDTTDEGEEEESTEDSDEQEESSEEVDEEDYEEEADEEETAAEAEEDIVGYNELPESIQKALDFMEETGGSLQDFLDINQDYSKLGEDEVIGRYLKSKYPTLDSEDVAYEIESRFGMGEDDTDAEIRRKKVEKKKFYAEALKSLESNAEKHRTELGSSAGLSAKAKEAIKFQEQFEAQQAQSSKALEAARSSFVRGSKKLIGKDFKGFEIKVGDETHLYKPENVVKTREQNLDINNLFNKFLDKNGNVKDIAGYHKMAAIASNPERFAQHFFELGQAAKAEQDDRESKNIKDKTGARQTQPNKKDPKKPKFKFLDDKSVPKGKIKLKSY